MKLVVVGCLPLYSNKATLARDESGDLHTNVTCFQNVGFSFRVA